MDDQHDVTLQVNDVTAGCEPVSIYVFSRHGTRYGKINKMAAMMKRLGELRLRILKGVGRFGTMCMEDIEGLEKWVAGPLPDMDAKLSTAGWKVGGAY